MHIIDPLGRPTITAGSDQCFRTCCPSVRPHFSKSSKAKQISCENIGDIVALAEWIIIDTCLVAFIFRGFKGKQKRLEEQTETLSTSPPVATASTSSTMSFSNDGSFLEQFKQMQNKTSEKISHEIKVESTPLPMKSSEPKQSEQEQAWYFEALKKAREIAQKSAVSTSTTGNNLHLVLKKCNYYQ